MRLCLPRKSVVRLTDRPDMTLDVYRGRETTIHTVYQRTPDIAISEVKECLQGQRTRSVFLDLLFVFCDL